MNILIVWRTIPTQWHVSSNFLPAIMKYLNEKGHSITLICFDNRRVQENVIEGLKRCCNVHIVPYPPKYESTLNNLFFPFKHKLIHNPFRPFSLKMMTDINKIISKDEFDIIFIEQMMEIYNLKSDLTAKRILYLADPLNHSCQQYLLKEEKVTKKLLMLISLYFQHKYELALYRKFDVYIFPAQEHRDLLQSYLDPRSKYCIIPQGVDTEFFTPDPDHHKLNTIMFSGNMSYPPNITAVQHFFENIYGHVKKEVPDLKIFIVGRDPTNEVLKYQSKDVVITGFVSDIREYFIKSAAIIVPIVVDDGGYKIKVLEAMAMGKACVSTSLGVKGLYVIDGKNVLVADDPVAFANDVILLLRDASLRRMLGVNARRHVKEHYSLESMCKQIHDTFQDILLEKHQCDSIATNTADEEQFTISMGNKRII